MTPLDRDTRGGRRALKFVASSSISVVTYEAANGTLEIEFTEGSCYRYYLVPERIFRGLINAESAGRFFAEHIRRQYRHEKI